MRKISSLLAIWAVMIMAMPTFANTRLQDDLITIGKPGSTANKRIKLGSQEIRSNTATSKLEYTHDGVTYKPIGSGSGAGGSSGGINLIANESFEDPITTGWSNTGGTFTQESYLNGTETDAKFARFVATAAGQYFETPLITVPTNFSGGCQADFKKISVSADDLFKVEILDSSSNVLATANVKKSSWVKFPTLNTTCPTPGSQFRLRVTSLAAGTIDSDYGYLGSNQNIVNIAQPKLIGTISISGCSTAWISTSTSLTDFPSVSGCTYSTTGQALAPTTNIPAIRFSSLQAGDYVLEYDGQLYSAVANINTYYQFGDGANLAREIVAHYGASSTVAVPEISQSISYATSQANVTLAIKTKVDSGGSSYLYGTNGNPAVIKVWYFPSSAETAVSPEQASWFIDANIGGANVGLGTGAQTSYVELQSVNLDLVINSSKGSASAEIACQSGVASSGLNCGGSAESFGIAFTPPWAGLFEVCTSFTQSQADGQDIVYQLAETSNTSSVIIQEGGARQAGNGSTGLQYPFYNCGTFNFSDISKKTIRLMFEKTATTANPQLIADRSATSGQRDMKWTVRPLLSAYNRPILTGDQLIMKGEKDPKYCSFFVSNSLGAENVCTSATCTTQKIIGGCANSGSVTRTGAGRYTFTLLPGIWIDPTSVNCRATLVAGGSGRLWPYHGNVFSSTVRTFAFDNTSAVGEDASFNVSCEGK